MYWTRLPRSPRTAPATQLFSLFQTSFSVPEPCLCLAGRRNSVGSRILGISGEGPGTAGPHGFLVIIPNQHRETETEQLPATSASLGAGDFSWVTARVLVAHMHAEDPQGGSGVRTVVLSCCARTQQRWE